MTLYRKNLRLRFLVEDNLLKKRIILRRELLDSSAIREVKLFYLRSGQTKNLQLPVLAQVYALKSLVII